MLPTSVLETYVNEGALPDAEEGSVNGLLGQAG